jgi:hypothetical protein
MRLAALSPVLALALAGPAGAATPPVPAPSQFSVHIRNPFLPLRAGSRWVYRETTPDGGRQRVVVTATARTRLVAGVQTRVVHDIARDHGRRVEDTLDYYAQDRAGDVWYFGEATREFGAHGRVSTAGSWMAGVNGATPGVVMLAHPRAGTTYRQEQAAGVAEDRARVLRLGEQAEVPFGHFGRALLTEEFTPVEPGALEYKLYARGVGQVLAVTVSGGDERQELLSFRR